MPYCTKADMEKLLPLELLVQLTDDEGLGTVGEPRLQEAVAQADAEIDGYAGVRYAVPVSPVPELLRKLSVDIAIYNLYSRSVVAVPEVRAERYKSAVKMLEAIARGTVSLGSDASVDTAVKAEGAETNRKEGDSVFSRQSMEGF